MHKVVSIALTLLSTAMCCGGIARAEADDNPAPLVHPSAAGEPFVTGPPEQAGSVVVRASFHLRDINDIDDEAETFEFGGVLKLTWHDERQAFDPAEAGVSEKVYLGAFQFYEVFDGWFPQVILVNESGLYEKHGVVLRVRSDGTLTLVEALDAVAEAELSLRRYPFDRQRLEAIFEVLGFDESEVVLRSEADAVRVSDDLIRMPQWAFGGVRTSTRDRRAPYAGQLGVASAFVVSMDVERESFFMVRLVIVPLMLIVMLSWSVFWMDRSSLGDRINVSFIGILTAVAYQIVVSEILPHISYLTFMNGFLNLSLIIMCASAVINPVVAAHDRRGRVEAGDLLDRRCRWIFPITYFGLTGIMFAAAFVFF